MKFLRMRPGYGEQLIAEGDVEVAEDEERLVAEFRRQLEQGMWAAVPVESQAGRREAEMVRAFEDIPRATRARRGDGEGLPGYDPGRERRAEQRARELLKSCVNEEEWAMYRYLGFLRVWGGQSHPDGPSELRGVDYAYLVYPHKPIVAYLPQTGRLLNEYCVEF